VDNAIKFTTEKGIVTITSKPLGVGISIKDIGLDTKNQDDFRKNKKVHNVLLAKRIQYFTFI
jgi:hypothetical protein